MTFSFLPAAKYKHLFFDLDRTLWDFEKNSTETLYEIFIHHQLQDKGIPSFGNFSEQYKKHNNHFWELYRNGKVAKDKMRYERFKVTLAGFGITDHRLTTVIAEEYIMESPRKTRLFPHAEETLEYLFGRYELHIITNGFEEVQHTKMNNSGIRHFFNQVVTSEMAGVKKPFLQIFHYSMKITGASNAESMMIGDHLEVDILPAKSLGMGQVYFNPDETGHNENVLHEIKSLKELKTLL